MRSFAATGLRSIALVSVLIFQSANVAHATLLRKHTVATLTTSATSIVIGKITDIRSQLESGEVWTVVTVRVEKTLKGGSSQTTLFRVPGGIQKVGGKTLVTRVEGLPDFTHMDRAVLFLEGNAPAYPTLLGFEQGYWKIRQTNGQEMAFSPSFDTIPLELLVHEIRKSLKVK